MFIHLVFFFGSWSPSCYATDGWSLLKYGSTDAFFRLLTKLESKTGQSIRIQKYICCFNLQIVFVIYGVDWSLSSSWRQSSRHVLYVTGYISEFSCVA